MTTKRLKNKHSYYKTFGFDNMAIINLVEVDNSKESCFTCSSWGINWICRWCRNKDRYRLDPTKKEERKKWLKYQNRFQTGD